MKSIIVESQDVQTACELACERIQGLRGEEVANGEGYEGPSASQRHFIGLLAEFAVAEYLDLPVNEDTKQTDPGYDFVVEGVKGSRVTVDVKGSTADEPKLLVEKGKVRADCYINSRVNFKDYHIDYVERSYQFTSNDRITKRRSCAHESDDLANASLEDVVVVDLLEWATKEMVLDAPVTVIKSDPSHTLIERDLLPLPGLAPAQVFGHYGE